MEDGRCCESRTNRRLFNYAGLASNRVGLVYLVVCTIVAVRVMLGLTRDTASRTARRIARLVGALGILSAVFISLAESALTGFYPQVFLVFDPIFFGLFVLAGIGVGYTLATIAQLSKRSEAG